MRRLPLVAIWAILLDWSNGAELRAQESPVEFKSTAPKESTPATLGTPLPAPDPSTVQPAQHVEPALPPLDPTRLPESTSTTIFELPPRIKRDWEIDWHNGLHFRSTDDAFHYHIGGRFDYDNAWYHMTGNLPVGATDDDRLRDGMSFRRLRLRADGTVYTRLDFVLEANFANIQEFQTTSNSSQEFNSVGITDVWLQLRDVPYLGTVRIGHFKEPIGLERMTSSNVWYYMERSPKQDAFFNAFQYSTGIMAFRGFLDDRMTLAAALTRSGSGTINQFGFGVGSYYAGTARITCLPYYEDEGLQLVHLGFAGSRRGVPPDRTLDVGNRALVRGGGSGSQNPNLIDTGPLSSADPVSLLNAEFAMIRGPFALSAEYALANAANVYTRDGNSQQVPHGDVWYHGGFVETGLFVTRGDHRRYDKAAGAFDRTVPNEHLIGERPGIGAFELVLRYSYLNLVGGNPVLTRTSGARAGEEHDITAGFNWYLNPEAILRVNYVWTHIRSVYPGLSGDVHGLGVRLHFDF